MEEQAVADAGWTLDKVGRQSAKKRKTCPRMTKAAAITQAPGWSSKGRTSVSVHQSPAQRKKASHGSMAGAANLQGRQQPRPEPSMLDLWQSETSVGADLLYRKPGHVAEVILPGTSYNPEFGQQQNALALAVAAEVRQALDRELQPTPPQRHIAATTTSADDLEQLQVEYDDEGEDEEVAAEHAPPVSSPKQRMKTRADRNRQQRSREITDAIKRREALKKQRRDVDQLQSVQAEIADEQSHAAARRLRRQVDRAEKAGGQPPRLGRRRFKAEPVQVLLSEEAGRGSLREVKAAAALARDSFKTLQKKGLIEAL